jgi:hypothetical protein
MKISSKPKTLLNACEVSSEDARLALAGDANNE